MRVGLSESEFWQMRPVVFYKLLRHSDKEAEAEDYRSGILAMLLRSDLKKGQKGSWTDYFPTWKRRVRQTDPEEASAVLSALARGEFE